MFDAYKKDGIQEITHVFSMTGVLWGLKRLEVCWGSTDPPKLTAYLPLTKHSDVAEFLNASCPALPPINFTERVEHESHSDAYNFYSAAKKVWGERGNISRALCAVSALDYACFDDMPVPTLCKEVYSNPHFQHKVLNAMQIKKRMKQKDCGKGHFP